MDKPSLWVWAMLRGATLVALAIEPAAAQTAADPHARTAAAAESPAYRELIDSAISEYEARNFLEARALFARAHALYGNARTFRGLGMVAFELREYPDSVAMLEEALASKVKPLEGDLRARTEELLARARSFVATVRLVVQPPDARLRIDGDVVVTIAQAATLRLSVGEHVLEVDAPGYTPERKTLEVVGGDDRTLTIALGRAVATPAEAARAASSQPGGPRTAARDEDDEAGVLTSPWFWTGAAVVAAAGVVAAFLVLDGQEEAEAPIEPRSGVTVGALRVAP